MLAKVEYNRANERDPLSWMIASTVPQLLEMIPVNSIKSLVVEDSCVRDATLKKILEKQELAELVLVGDLRKKFSCDSPGFLTLRTYFLQS